MLGFIEGSMERQFVNANFKYVTAVPVQNGITWTCERLCSQIVTAYRAFDYNGDVFVWVDREGRNETAPELRDAIRNALIGAGADPLRLYVLINDRMSENIILADEQAVSEEFDFEDYNYEFEGRGGKGILKRFYKDLGINYKEMVQGAKLLKKIRLSNSAQKSPTVQSFLDQCGLECWWF